MQRRWLLLAIVFLVGAAGTAIGQETRDHDLPELGFDLGRLGRVKPRVTLADRFVGGADFGSFRASSNQPEGRVQLNLRLAHEVSVRVVSRGRALLYDFDGPVGGIDPFDDLFSVGLGIQSGYLLPERWTLFSEGERWALVAETGMRASWEGSSAWTRGLRGGGSLAAGYRLGDRFEAAAGFTLLSRLTGSGVRAVPLLEFEWQIDDAWTLGSYGVGLQLERKLGKRVALFGRARYERSRFRLGDRPGLGRGTMRVFQVPVGVGVDWRITSFLRLRVLGGVMAYNRLEQRAENNDLVGRVTAQGASAYGAVRLDLRR